MRKENGISLVALIITIIVMVILAGIVLVTAVMDGGIIDRAQIALVENERGEIEDIVIGSYVYKTTASMDIIGQLDLEETAKSLYSNLTGNNYKVKTIAGAEAQSYDEIYTTGANSISLSVEGKHGKYEGIVEKNGLKEGMKIVEEVPPVDDDNLPGDEEIVDGMLDDDNNPLTIGSIEDLIELSLEVNNGKKYEGQTVNLLTSLDFNSESSYRTENPETSKYIDKNGNEIDINGDGNLEAIMTELTTGKGFNPIGQVDLSGESEGIQFKGNFNGNGNVIKNLYINRPEKIASLFGGVSANTVIQNLTLENPNIYGSYSTGIAVSMDITGETTSTLKIENCHIKNGKIGMVNENGVSMTSCGLVYAFSIGKIDVINCTNSSTISGIAGCGIGYLMGLSQIYVNGCSNNGNIIVENEEIYINAEKEASDNGVAGCVMAATPSGVVVNNCKNYGILKGIKGGVAGIINGSGAMVSNCENHGELISENPTGYIDIAGIYRDPGYDMAEDCTGSVKNVVNNGNITIMGEKLVSFEVSGILAGSYMNGPVISAINKGNITISGYLSSSSSSYLAGINVGEKNTVLKSINYGNIDLKISGGTSTRIVAGISTACKEVISCVNYGNISAETCAGIAYDHSNYVDTAIYNCYNLGNLITKNRGAGIGVNSTIKNCYNLGSITSENTSSTKESINIGGTETNCFALNKTETVEEKQSLLNSLNSNREDIDTWSEWKIDSNLNEGYPAFSWQK